jgi:hypothetical protein
MSYQSISQVAGHEVEPPQPKESIWQPAWKNNKGACLILLAELAGASMDAMARFLQQGDTKFHPFQVLLAAAICGSITDGSGYRCPHGYHLHHEQHIHVVD